MLILHSFYCIFMYINDFCMKLLVKDLIKSTVAAFHDEGLLIWTEACPVLEKGQKVEISFVGITRCSTQFLNSSIGKLYTSLPKESVDSLLSIDDGGLASLKQKINEVIENATSYREYDSLLDQVAF